MNRTPRLSFLAAGCVYLAAQTCFGMAQLSLSDGTTTVVIADGDASDSNATTGVVTYVGSVGNFSVNISSGLTFPVLGSPSMPLLDVSSFNGASTGAGTLDLVFTATGFTTTGLVPFNSAIGGTTDGSVTLTSWYDPSNTPFGTTTVIAGLGPLTGSPLSFSAEDLATIGTDGEYSLSIGVSITHDSAGQSTSFDAALKGTPPGEVVPEPASIFCWCGLGLAAAGLSWTRRRVAG